MMLLYAGVFTGSWLLGKKSRAGWLALAVGNIAGVVLNLHLGILIGVLGGAVNLALTLRGYARWNKTENPNHGN